MWRAVIQCPKAEGTSYHILGCGGALQQIRYQSPLSATTGLMHRSKIQWNFDQLCRPFDEAIDFDAQPPEVDRLG